MHAHIPSSMQSGTSTPGLRIPEELPPNLAALHQALAGPRPDSPAIDDWEIDITQLHIEAKIASGAFSNLYKGSYCGQEVAVKILKDVQDDSTQYQEFLQVRAQQAACPWHGMAWARVGWIGRMGIGAWPGAAHAHSTARVRLAWAWPGNTCTPRAPRPGWIAGPVVLAGVRRLDRRRGFPCLGACMQEVSIMRKVRHKNVVQFIGACTRKPNLCIVFEYMSGGSAYDYIRRVRQAPAWLGLGACLQGPHAAGFCTALWRKPGHGLP